MSPSKINKTLALLAVILLASCKEATETQPVPPRTVITFEVPDTSGDQQRRFSGQTEAAVSVELGFQVSGRIAQIIAKTGQRYQQGETLAILDSDLYDADLATARANAVQAAQELRRTQELFESGNASKADFDSAIASQKAAEASLKSAVLNVEYTTLRMPYDGFIASVPGDSNQVVSVGSPVVNIQSETGMDFEVGIPTSLISEIKEGQQAKINLGNLPEKELVGTVVKISPSAQSNTTYPVTLRIENSDNYPNLRADMDGEARFTFPKEGGEQLAVPVSAVLAAPDGSNYVWLIQNPDGPTSGVTLQTVTIGNLDAEGLIEIPTGLNPGEILISKGASRVSAGMTVTLPKN